MRNLVIILLILILPIIAYITLDGKKNGDVISTAQAGDKPVVMIFTSAMCSDCVKMKKVLKVVEPNFRDKIDFVKINAGSGDSQSQSMVKKYNVYLVPTLVFIDKAGNQKERVEHSMTQPVFEKKLKDLING